MPDFLTRRCGTWHFVRRVPLEFARFDQRGIVKHSTRIRVAEDRTGRRAARVAERLNVQLEAFWRASAGGAAGDALSRYESIRAQCRTLGFDYVDNASLVEMATEERLKRLEALVVKGLVNEPVARAALLGTEKRPVFPLSKLFDEYEPLVADENKGRSPNQMRIWRNERIRAVANFVDIVGDKPITELSEDDGLDYADFWRKRVAKGETLAKTANKEMGQLSRMLKDMSVRRRLKLPDIFAGLRLRGEVEKSRCPFAPEFIQNRLLATGALDGLNEEARHVIYMVAETGMRLSEVVNLAGGAIHLDGPIPYVEVLPDGRRPKTEDSIRSIPLVGIALQVMRHRPHGFPRYRDKSSGLSGALNKFLTENKLRPTPEHTVYSLRHSFKDRLVAAEAPDSLIDSLMGHRTGKPKYGSGPPLELKLKFLSSIAFTPPERL